MIKVVPFCEQVDPSSHDPLRQAQLLLQSLPDAEIEAGPAVRDKQRGHLRLVHANADPIASDARLRHFEQCIADSIAIADADLPVGETVDGEVFAELAKDEVIAAELALPIAVGLN
jgi:hypothetical protein